MFRWNFCARNTARAIKMRAKTSRLAGIKEREQFLPSADMQHRPEY